jgi:hypothetical membrane protein
MMAGIVIVWALALAEDLPGAADTEKRTQKGSAMKARSKSRTQDSQPRTWYGKASGVLLLVSGAAILMGIITAEALYPATYSTHHDTVSDLAAMRPHNLIRQPSAAIFNWTMIVAGLLLIASAYLLYRAFQKRAIPIPTALLGIGILGVGIFPGNHLTPHQLFATLAFTAGSIAALLSWKVLNSPLRYFTVALGTAASVSLVLGFAFIDWAPVARLGEGGIERWIAYPVVLWMVGFGAWLASRPAATTEPPQPGQTARLEPAEHHPAPV